MLLDFYPVFTDKLYLSIFCYVVKCHKKIIKAKNVFWPFNYLNSRPQTNYSKNKINLCKYIVLKYMLNITVEQVLLLTTFRGDKDTPLVNAYSSTNTFV